MLGEFLYGITAQEARSSPVVQRWNDQVIVPLVAATVDADSSPVPKGKALILTCFVVEGSGTGGQTINFIQVRLLDEVLNITGRLGAFQFPTALTFQSTPGGYQHLVLLEGERIRGTVNFSAGAVQNTARITTHGLLLPRGSLQLR